VFRASRNCPRQCDGTLTLFRSRPSPYRKILGHQLWICQTCEYVFETSNVIVRQAPQDYSKNWISRIEARIEDLPKLAESRRRQRAKRAKSMAEDSNSERDGEPRKPTGSS